MDAADAQAMMAGLSAIVIYVWSPLQWMSFYLVLYYPAAEATTRGLPP